MTEERQPKKPSYEVLMVHEQEGRKAIWTEIGALWPHPDGKGFNVTLRALPLIGDGHRLIIRAPKERTDKAEAGR